nr:MAG TPA: hypothetical protein [Caudoviricetes sp.]
MFYISYIKDTTKTKTLSLDTLFSCILERARSEAKKAIALVTY